jgi:hypothetical protein
MPTTGQSGSTPAAGPADSAGSQAFRDSFGEDLSGVLDIATWSAGADLAQEYPRIEAQVREALSDENEVRRRTTEQVLPRLFDPVAGPPQAGVYAANWDVLRLVHRGLLFNGGVEACDGTVHVHDTLPLTIYQVGIGLTSYRGDRGTWHHRLFRRDLRRRGGDPVDEALELLRRRSERSALNHDTPGDRLGQLAHHTLMQYAERAVLLRRSRAVWRMGHGNPITYELLTGADLLELMVAGTTVLRQLIEGHRKFVFVASEPRDRLLLTVGDALPPMHYAVVSTLEDHMRDWFHQRRFTLETAADLAWDGEPISPMQWIPRFLERVASQVAVGVYRATRAAPAQLFYAHNDHVHTAAHIVLADSMLQEQRGFPLLIDLAHHLCRTVFGESLRNMTEAAYAAAGEPWRYFSERMTRGD